MAKMSKPELVAFLASYVNSSLVTSGTFTVTTANTVGLLDKVAKIITLDSTYADKLEMFEAEYLNFAKSIEEYKSDLIMPQTYDPTGANALAPHRGTYRPVTWSFTLGRLKVPQTIDFDDVERGVHTAEQFASVIADKYKAQNDSLVVMRYAQKKQALGLLIDRCEYAMDASNATSFTANANHTNIGGLYKDSNNVTYVLVKKYTANAESDVAGAVASGYLIEYKLTEEVPVPVDATTGEDFIVALKKDAEIADDMSEGRSLSGNTLGKSPAGLVLIVKQGIMPELEAKTYAGAFNRNDIVAPFEIVRVPDFGDYSGKAYAILMDRRGLKRFPTYKAVRENLNGDGDFLNLFAHEECTIHISNNTFVKVYEDD